MNMQEYDKIARSGCFVCKIVEGKPLIPNPQIIYEDEKVIAFLNQLPTQKGYTIVAPKKHAERYEKDLTEVEWVYLQKVVQNVAKAVSLTTNAMRMYVASLGTPERNPHIHIHVCPCPPGTPFDEQQFKAMEFKDGKYLELNDDEMREIAEKIKENL